MNVAWITALSDLLVATAVLPALLRRTQPSVLVLAGQGIVLALLATAFSPDAAGMITAALVLLAKGVVVPRLIYRTAQRARALELAELPIPWSYLGVLGVLLAVQLLTPTLTSGHFAPATAQFVTASVATTSLGLLVVATHRILHHQILGIALAENGLYGAGIALAHGLPLVLDLGVVFDLLLALFLLAWLTGRIHDSWGHVDAEQLKGLRG